MRNLTETDQFKNGADVANWLDIYFEAKGFTIEPTTPHEERVLCLGDRKYTKGPKLFFIEYKSGIQTYYTGNVFIETISVDNPCAPGWAYTCQADFIFYAALLNRKILIFQPEKIRAEIADLKSKFKSTKTGKGQNEYHTHGVLVPLDYAESHLAQKVITLEGVTL